MNLLLLKSALTLCLMVLVLSNPTQTIENQATFSAKLFNEISQKNINKNVIISPASIQTCLALAYYGARGTTAEELRRGLHLGNEGVTKEQVAQQFEKLMGKMRSSEVATVNMANRIYVKQNLHIAPKFNEVAQKSFDSGAENVDFSQNVQTAAKINNWIEQQTENKIHDLVSPKSLDGSTTAILVNAIYFKANWWNSFSTLFTDKTDFHLSKTKSRQVDMMYQMDSFGFADLSEFDAKALCMEYNGTTIKLLVLLPNKLDGLSQLEQKLKDIDQTNLLTKLNLEKVHVSFPKFRIKFEISLKPTLNALGMRELFSPGLADFSGLFTTHHKVAVSEVVHKAFISFDEHGTEATGATALRPLYVRKVLNHFKVDHPFYFALLDDETVYFAGHVVDI